MNKLLSCTMVCLSLFVMTGCNRGLRYDAQVNTFINEEFLIPRGATYVVLPGPDIAEDLAFKQYAKMVEMKLNKLGYRQSDKDTADIAIFISYSVDLGRTQQYAYTEEVYGKTGGGTTTVQGMNLSTGQMYTGTVTTPETHGVVGSRLQAGSYTVYTRSLIVNATDLREYRLTRKIEQLWKADVYSSGPSNDLRRVMPALIEAGFRHFATDTKRQINYTLWENDDTIRALRGEPVDTKSPTMTDSY